MTGTHRTCEICGIKERSTNEKRFFARFPLDKQRCSEWLKVVGKEELAYLPFEKLHDLRHICEIHYAKRDFTKSKTRLKKRAIPKLHLTAPQLNDNIIAEFLQLNSHDIEESKALEKADLNEKQSEKNITENTDIDNLEEESIESDLKMPDIIDEQYINDNDENMNDNDELNINDNNELNDNDKENINDNDIDDELYVERLDEDILNDEVLSFLELCRACLSKDETKPMPDDLTDMFLNLTGLPNEDRLPKVMCDECEQNLNRFSEFKNKCVASNQWLFDKIIPKSNRPTKCQDKRENSMHLTNDIGIENDTLDLTNDTLDLTNDTLDLTNDTAIKNDTIDLTNDLTIDNDTIGACVEISNTVNINSKTTKPISMIMKPRILNHEMGKRKRKKIVVRMLDKDRNKLIPIPSDIVPKEIKEFVNKMRNRSLHPVKLKPKLSATTNKIVSTKIDEKPQIENQVKKRKYKPRPIVDFSDESDTDCNTIASNKKKRKIKTKGKTKEINQETSEKDENVEEQNENDESYNLHKDLVFDHKILDNLQLILPTFFTKRKISIEEQKNHIKKRKTSANYLKRPYKCDLCYHGFVNKSAYDAHMILHTSRAGNIICEVCHIRKQTKLDLKHHRAHHAIRFYCKFCPLVCTNRMKSFDHILEMHSTRLYTCDICGHKLKSLQSLQSHKRTKHPCKYFCKYCGYSFRAMMGLKQHLAIRHRFIEQQITTEEIYCYTCDITFMNKDAYETHKKVSFQHGECVAQNNTYKVDAAESKTVSEPSSSNIRICEWCGLDFKNYMTYRSHIQRAHPEKYEPDICDEEYILCELCGKNIKRDGLANHCKLIHNFIPKTNECEVCNMKFRWKKNMNKHFRTHHYDEYCAKKEKRNAPEIPMVVDENFESD